MPEAMAVDAAPAAAETTPAPVDTKKTLAAALANVDRWVGTRESRFISQALRALSVVRQASKANAAEAASVVKQSTAALFPASHPLREPLLAALTPLAAGAAAATEEGAEKKKRAAAISPESELYHALLVLLLQLDGGALEPAVGSAALALDRLSTYNRRTLDPISEKIYFYASWAHERAGKLGELRSSLLAYHRTACLHHNAAGQAVLLNSLLRNYLHHRLLDQADKLLAKASFPDGASNCQLARFLYYSGRIKALQLEYSDAHRCLLQAQRKSPQSRALGFRLAVHKLGAIVQLLLGEVPDRAFFRAKQSRTPMLPYLELVQAVRRGDLLAFKVAMEAHAKVFAADGNTALIGRLRQNVIRAGLRNISLAYSRIPLAEVAQKLKLDRPEDMESIVAKAIRDGVIDATLDHSAAVLLSRGGADVYTTLEPQAAFHKRITFCLNVHNDAVRAMSYPPDSHKDELPDAETLKERQREEQELVAELAEEEEEMGDGF